MTSGGLDSAISEETQTPSEGQWIKQDSDSSQDLVVPLMAWFAPVDNDCLIPIPRNTREYVSMVSEHQMCGYWLQYPGAINTDFNLKKVGWC